MLRDYPIKFEDTTLFRPEKWNEKYEKVVSSKQSEAGTDIVTVTRTGKLSISADFNCTDVWLAKFMQFDAMGSFTMSKYDVISGGYKQYTVRIENLSVTVEIHSDYIKTSNGLYVVSFDIKEF